MLGIPGVVGAEVAEMDSGAPSVRIWTDDSRDPAELDAEVRAIVSRARATGGEHPSRQRQSAESADAPPATNATDVTPDRATVSPLASAPNPSPVKRSGLGRGLDSLISVAGSEPAPAHLVSIDLTTQSSLEMIAIEESAGGVTVRAMDTAGVVAEAKVIGAAGSINPTIVAAVAELLGETPAPRLVSVELRDTEVAAVMVVTLELVDTTVAAGAAVVQGGMPFTLGKASWAAIRSVRP